jgi:branched-chain amino acid transport system substrate-binding protein
MMPGGPAFVKSYEREGFTQPYEAWGIFGYASVEVLAEAIRRAGPNPTRRAVIEQMMKGTFNTAIGRVSFDRDGQTRLVMIFVDQVQKKTWTPKYRADEKGRLVPVTS